jgi:hypothetical protein
MLLFRQFFGNMPPTQALGLTLIVVIVVFGVLGSVYEKWRK